MPEALYASQSREPWAQRLTTPVLDAPAAVHWEQPK